MDKRIYSSALIFLFLFSLFAFSSIVLVNTVSFGEPLDAQTLRINIIEDDVEIGYVRVRVLDVDNYPYNIIIEIFLDNNIIIKLTNSQEPTSILKFRVEYYINNRSASPSYIEKYFDYYPIGLYLSSIIPADALSHIFILNITLDYAFIGNETIGGSIDIYKYMVRNNLKTDFLKDLEHYVLYFHKIVNDQGWYTYKIYSGGKYIGRLEVVASHIFKNTSDLRLYLEIYDRRYIDLMNVSVSIHGILGDLESEFSKEFLLYPGEDIILPKELGMGITIVTLDSINIKFDMLDYTKTLNLTSDIGVVTLSPQKELVAFPLQSKFLSYKDIGNGWVEVKIGLFGDINKGGLDVRYTPIIGDGPIVMRCFLVREMNYSYVLYTYLIFPEPGVHSGYLLISDGGRQANISINIRSSGYPEDISIRTIKDEFIILNLDQYLQLEISRLERVIKMRLIPEEKELKYLERILYLKSKVSRPGNKNIHVLYIPVNTSLGFSEYYRIKLAYDIESYDVRSPVMIIINPVYEDILGEPEIGVKDSVFGLINGSTYGKLSMGPWIKYVKDELILTLFNPYSGSLYGDVPNLVGFEIYFYNVADIKVSDIEVNYVALPSPSEPPHVAELLVKEPYGGFEILNILISDHVFQLILGLLTAIFILIVVVILRKEM